MPLTRAARRAAGAALALLLAAGAPAAGEPSTDPRIATLLDQISARRLQATVEKLVGFGTRNTLSSAEAPGAGIGAARQWIFDEMQAASPRLQVSFDSYEVLGGLIDRIPRDVLLRNVMAVLPGKSPRRVYVSGHYDSLARRVEPGAARASGATGGFDWAHADNPAPGANDDGSGTALTLELLRVFSQSGIEFEATLVFVCFAGEEQGLVGAKLHAQKAAAEHWPIEAVLNNDIVGNSHGGNGVNGSDSLRVFSEGGEDSPSRELARFVKRQAALYVPGHTLRLVARHDRFGRGGDHTAFNQHGFAAVRFSESHENYARQHTVDDTPDAVDFEYLARNARVNAAALGVMGLAPQAPAVADERGRPLLARAASGYDAQLRWKASPGAAGYRIFWRDALAPDWQHELAVGAVTEAVLKDLSIDDCVFGVASFSPGGHESLVSAYVNPPRPMLEIKTR